MSKQVQLRRGTSLKTEGFVGASGEVTVDTTTNSLVVHDGSTLGGFKVPTLIKVQYPTKDNSERWFRLYSDGWVEQGGHADTSTGYQPIQLLVEMADYTFNFMITRSAGTSTTAVNCWTQSPLETKSTTIVKFYTSASTGIDWEVKGMADMEAFNE